MFLKVWMGIRDSGSICSDLGRGLRRYSGRGRRPPVNGRRWAYGSGVVFGDEGDAVPGAVGEGAGVESNFAVVGEFLLDVGHADGEFAAAVRTLAVVVAAESSTVFLREEGGAAEAGGGECELGGGVGGAVAPGRGGSGGVSGGGRDLRRGDAFEGDDEGGAVVEGGELVWRESAPGPVAVSSSRVAAVAAAVTFEGACVGEGDVLAVGWGGFVGHEGESYRRRWVGESDESKG